MAREWFARKMEVRYGTNHTLGEYNAIIMCGQCDRVQPVTAADLCFSDAGLIRLCLECVYCQRELVADEN